MKFYGTNLQNGHVQEEDVFDKMKNAAGSAVRGSDRSSDESGGAGAGQSAGASQERLPGQGTVSEKKGEEGGNAFD
jgi:hypothetical protein